MIIIDIPSIARQLENYYQIILPDVLPSGRIEGKHWVCANIHGGAGSSFKFNMETGTFKDFATGEGGKDIVALYSKQKNCSQKDAAIYLKEKYIGDMPLVKYKAEEPNPRVIEHIVKPPTDIDDPECPLGADMYKYKDENNELLFCVVRIDKQDGSKAFYPISFDANTNRWVKKRYIRPSIFGLETIAQYPAKPVLIVEGEKACLAARTKVNAYNVVTWSGGANAWKSTDWSPLQKRKVLIWPDADKPGIECSTKLSEYLLNEVGAEEVKLIMTDKSDGWDAHDAFVKEQWDYKAFASWAKVLTIIKEKPKKVEVITQEEIPARVPKDSPDDLIPTEDFPVSPNLQMYFIDLGVLFSDAKKTRVIMNASNVVKILRADFPDIVWRDSFYGKIFTKWNTGRERQWSDIDTNNLYIKMQHHYELGKLSKAHVLDAIECVASMNEKNEPQEWLKSLKWDGEKRIEKFFFSVMGAEDSTYTSAVSKNFWVAMAARIMDPGCKCDEMVILEGRQGTYKTTSLELIGGKWYGEANSDISTKDFDQGLRGKIIVEFGELASLKNADIELIKRKLSTRIDEYRPSYGRYVEQHPRTCIFVATTNQKQYLKDLTGNRRFLPMRIKRADTEYIKKFREQLFAEALHEYNSGSNWHDIPFEEAEAIREQRMEVSEQNSALADVISREKYRAAYIVLSDVWVDMGGRLDNFGTKQQRELGAAMRQLGYNNKVVRINGTPIRVWEKELALDGKK